ncbi:flagellar assembly protein FliH [Reinekea blandensis]|uniref:Flagellar assembly protein FliH n=1 Tax=Reinekea blandensis MED297 TaxID=314283 RepID=A4BIN3_9GAMM|nr:flagellar assembly protein FliH [Reinekea blandensis]EAR07997.1 putative flagellar assembly protein [Reinekea sp. MED297] [Reinekea blandensis MED297]
MSVTHKGVVRRNDADIEDYNLPRWDKDGNLVKPARAPEKATEVEDVAEQDIKMPTLAEIEAIREAAYNEGFEQGYEGGMKEGHRTGEQSGLQQGHEQGYQDGLAQGREEGLNQALTEEREKTDQKLAVLDAVSETLKGQVQQEQEALKEALLALSVRIARQVVQDELRLEPNHIAQVVHAAVQSLPNPDDRLTVQVHPDDLPVVRDMAESHWTLETTEEVAVGGCIVKSGYSLVDYTLEHRFSNAVAHFLSELAPADPEKIQTPLSEQALMPNDGITDETTSLEDGDDVSENAEQSASSTDNRDQSEAFVAGSVQSGSLNEPAAEPSAGSMTEEDIEPDSQEAESYQPDHDDSGSMTEGDPDKVEATRNQAEEPRDESDTSE